MNLDTFCSDVVPDFTPLGGNRSDCAVVMAAALGLVDEPSLPLLLPPDVLDTAMAMLCAQIIIHSVSDVVPPRPTGCDRLSCRLRIESDVGFGQFGNCQYDPDFDKSLPWQQFDTVCLQIVLPNSITSCPSELLTDCRSLATVDLRNTKLQSVGSFFLYGCSSLTEAYLPDTLHTAGEGFLNRCESLVLIDLRNTQLHKAERWFMSNCERLTAVHLPDTLRVISDDFLEGCSGFSEKEIADIKRRVGCVVLGISPREARVNPSASLWDWLSTNTALAFLAAAVAMVASIPVVTYALFGEGSFSQR